MKKIRLLLIYGSCVLGLVLTACGQNSNKNPDDNPSLVLPTVHHDGLASSDTATEDGDNNAITPYSALDITGEYVTGVPVISGYDSLTNDPVISGDEKITETVEITPTPLPTEKPVLTRAVGVPGRAPTNTPTPVPVKEITEVSKTMYPSIKVNVREESSSSSKLIGAIDVNESVHVTGLCDNGWARVDYGGGIGYVSYKYLSDSKVAVATSTPTPTPTPTPQVSNSFPVNDSHGKHKFNQTYHDSAVSYYNQNLDIIESHFECVNELRESVGVGKLTLDYTVSEIASYRTAEMVDLDFFSHNHPGASGSKCFVDVVYFYQNGYTLIGENISNISGEWNYFYRRDQLGEQLFTQFKNSPTHYANMVNSKYTKMGIGVYVSDDYVLITQIFE